MVSIGLFPGMQRARVLLLLSASLLLAGCASIPPTPKANEEYLRAHYILAHEDGFALSITERQYFVRKRLSAKAAKEDIEARIIAGVDAHALRLWPNLGEKEEGEKAKGDALQLMVYAHGGLNGYGEDFARMRALLATPSDCNLGLTSRLFVSAVCSNARSRYYPVFINWNSEAWDSIRDDLLFIRFGKRVVLETSPLILTAPFVTMGRLAEAIFNAPNSFAANVSTFVDSEPGVGDFFEGALTFIPRILITPIVKAFGRSAWDVMNRRAGVLTAPLLDGKREGVVLSLLTELNRRIEVTKNDGVWWRIPSRRGARVPIEITLVGHSMGAIVVNRILVASRGLPTASAIKRVVYLGAAAPIKAVEAVKLINQANEGVHFWNFMLNHRDEARERNFLWLAPRGTLLVWVDDFFETVVEPADKRDGNARSQKEFWGRWPAGPGICEWDGPGRPLSHAALGELDHLEAELRYIDRNLFAPEAAEPKSTVHCVQPKK